MARPGKFTEEEIKDIRRMISVYKTFKPSAIIEKYKHKGLTQELLSKIVDGSVYKNV